MNLDFLFKCKFDRHLKYLNKKLKGKKILFYGAGLFFDLIHKHYDLSELNVIGIVDKLKSSLQEGTEICGYKLYSPDEITELNPDYIVITTKKVLEVAEWLYYDCLKNSKIKLIPLVKKSFIDIITEN